jgi:osmotically-inducible protein OsmY
MPNRNLSRRPAFAALLFAVLGASGLAGCAGALIGGGAAVGVAAYEERGVEGAARDLRTSAQVTEQWFQFDHTLPTKVSVEVYEGRALLTGAVKDPQVQADAVRLAWKAAGVQDVINEIQVLPNADVIDTAKDSWITTQLSSKITFDKQIMAVNYAIETVNGVIYLIGIAQNQAELDRVMAYARAIPNVTHIVSHVRVKQAV